VGGAGQEFCEDIERRANQFMFFGPRYRVLRRFTKAGIRWHGWHAFRRGLATNLHRLGVSDKIVQKILRHSGVFDLFLRQGHLPTAVVVSRWGNSQLQAKDFFFALPSSGWQVDRNAFDRMLADAAVAAGATVWTETRLSSCPRRDPKGWHFEARTTRRKSTAIADFPSMRRAVGGHPGCHCSHPGASLTV